MRDLAKYLREWRIKNPGKAAGYIKAYNKRYPDRHRKQVKAYTEKTKEKRKRKYLDNREEMLIKNKEQYLKHREERLAKASEYAIKNKEIIKVYRHRNRKHITEVAKIWREKNREKVREINRRAYYRNKHLHQLHGRLYKAKKRTKSDGSVTRKSVEELYQKQKGLCAICGNPIKIKELDHIKPINKGGGHTISNVQWTCRYCNRHKRDNYDK